MPKIIDGAGWELNMPEDPTAAPRKARPCRHITIRISDEIVRDLKWMAWDMDIPYQSLLKVLLYERVRHHKVEMLEAEKRLSDILEASDRRRRPRDWPGYRTNTFDGEIPHDTSQ